MVNGLFPYESKRWDRGGAIRMAYVDEGQGDPVVMVHGNPTWSFYYRRLIEELRPHHRCIAPDHVGCGRSDKPTDDDYDYTLATRVADLEGLLDHLGVSERVTLIVHDWGGMIGTAWAVRHPERISRLVILNTAAFGLPSGKRFPAPLALTRTRLGAWLVQRHNLFCRMAARVCVTKRPLSREVRNGYLAPYDSAEHRIGVLRFVQDIPLDPSDPAWDIVEDTAQHLDALQTKPAMICWGEKDFVFDHHFLAEWRRRLPQARVHTYPEAGHYVLEDEAEDIVNRVREFVA